MKERYSYYDIDGNEYTYEPSDKVKQDNSIFVLINQLERELSKLIPKGDKFALTVRDTRQQLEALKSFF